MLTVVWLFVVCVFYHLLQTEFPFRSNKDVDFFDLTILRVIAVFHHYVFGSGGSQLGLGDMEEITIRRFSYIFI